MSTARRTVVRLAVAAIAFVLGGCDAIASIDRAVIDWRLRTLKREFQQLGERCAPKGARRKDVESCVENAGYPVARSSAEVVRISRCIGTQCCGGVNLIFDIRTDTVVRWEADASRAPLRMM